MQGKDGRQAEEAKRKGLHGRFVPALLSWYDWNARILPWRNEPTPYRVWVSEIMLQQTRVEAVKPYYDRFMEELPDVQALAGVEDDKLMKLWEGLGYYNRARNLKAAACEVMERFGGRIPAGYEELLSLKGIGEYTAGAIASIAYGIAVPAVDGNVMRVVARVLGSGDDVLLASTKRWMTKEVAKVMPKERPGDFNQALMELGATVCIPNGNPLCGQCPWDTVCQAHREGRELSYPCKQAKKPRRKEEKRVYLLEYEGRYALRRRPKKGLLAGLWEFPTVDGGQPGGKRKERFVCQGEEDGKGREEDRFGAAVEEIGEGKHIFSHVEWHMTGYHVLLARRLEDKELVWATKRELEERYPIPAAFEFMKKYLFARKARPQSTEQSPGVSVRRA